METKYAENSVKETVRGNTPEPILISLLEPDSDTLHRQLTGELVTNTWNNFKVLQNRNLYSSFITLSVTQYF
jgi:hypothetical protein